MNTNTLSCGARTLDLSAPVVMGVLNVTPDSFSDGGRYTSLDAALRQAEQMLADMQLRAVFNAISSSAAGGSLGLGLPIPAWVSFAMVINTEGRVVAPFGCPVLTFGKKSSLQDGLLVPNPYFSSPARGLDWWEDFADASFERAARRPWDLRERSVFFRGACGPGAHARFDLMRIRDATGLVVIARH